MGLNAFTRTMLERYTTHTPPIVDDWHGPWNAILIELFPVSRGYIVTPRRREEDVFSGQFSDLVIEVAKVTSLPATYRTVLVVKIKGSQHWDHGKEDLIQEIGHWRGLAFQDSGSETRKLYWIGVIGSHWVYGERGANGNDPKPLIEWHDVTHDDASYRDFLQLVKLVASL
jgi:hypothetical protein